MENKYGLTRVISPPQVFPASAWQLDNSRALRSGELRISIRRIHIEGTSFRQICQEANYDEEIIKEKIKDIVIKRGKMHNPVTDTGGLLYGVIDEIAPDYNNVKGFEPGEEVICNTSLAGMPLYIDRINKVDKMYTQVEAEGYAIVLPGTPVIRKPANLPIDLLLFTFNESGTLYNVSKAAAGKKRFAVVGNNAMMTLLFGYTIRKTAGEDALIYGLMDEKTELLLKGKGIDELTDKVFTEVTYHNLLRPVDCLRTFKKYPLVDMTVNCSDIPGAETVNVMATKSGGTVIFANFISNYNIALYVTESISRDLKIQCADGYLEEYDEYDFEIVKELAPYFKDAEVKTDRIRKRGASADLQTAGFDSYNHFDVSMAEDFIAVSRSMHTVMKEIMSVSKYDCNVLITGETGVGKDKVANMIQKNSSRKVQPFIKINCASISPNLIESEFFGYEKGAFTGANAAGKKGLFEAADNGVIFLDEVGELPLDIQAKLLRVIQDGEFIRVGGTVPVKTNVRIISATNRDLEEQVEKKQFRRDLYYRLNVFPIKVPALSERRDDIPPLTDLFIRKYNEKFGVSKEIDDDAREYLRNCDWPGNIRELENVVQRLMISCKGDTITVLDVMKELHSDVLENVSLELTEEQKNSETLNLGQLVESFEKNIIRYACEKHGSTRKAAKAIGISQTQLVRKKNKYEL
ncbi:MAG: sigma 54-interacting transcriptional regulator [Bacillota bacterium]|nr:sigma 54-interacting transcriptional regulator [Bacillota bacterium]